MKHVSSRWQPYTNCKSFPQHAKARKGCRRLQIHCVQRDAPVLDSPSSKPAVPTRDMSTSLTLTNIRNSLIRQEDTIIFNFIERAQFARNEAVYNTSVVAVPGTNDGTGYSLLEYMLRETEQLHAKVRRYTSPDEHAFYPDTLPPMLLPPMDYPNVLAPCADSININNRIMDVYLNKILPGISSPGDDGNYGSAACLDVLCLQTLSKRIHYGKFVAEAKFRAKPDTYSALIRANDSAGLMELLTDRAVELQVVERVRLKAATYGQDLGTNNSGTPGGVHYKVEPDVVAQLYDDIVMPMTKDVQVAYLLRRLD